MCNNLMQSNSRGSGRHFIPLYHFHVQPLAHCFALLQTPWRQEAHFFQGSCSIQMFSALWIHNLERCDHRQRPWGSHYRVPHFRVKEKIRRCELRTRSLYKGERRALGGWGARGCSCRCSSLPGAVAGRVTSACSLPPRSALKWQNHQNPRRY